MNNLLIGGNQVIGHGIVCVGDRQGAFEKNLVYVGRHLPCTKMNFIFSTNIVIEWMWIRKLKQDI